MKAFALVAFKVLVSIGLISWLLSRADLGQIWHTIQTANYALLMLAFLMFFIGYFLAARRWQILLAALGVPARLLTLVQSFSIAILFNNFLPSTIGGDAYRMYDSFRLGAGKSRAVAVVFIDRVVGLSALILLAFMVSLFAVEVAEQIPLLRLFLAGAMLGILALSWIVFGSGGKVLMRLTGGSSPPMKIIHGIMGKLYYGFQLFEGRSDVLLKAVGLSLLLQINAVIHCLIIARALQIEVPVVAMFIIIPLSFLIMTAPISINGIGLRESVFVFFFGLYGVAPELALAFSFVSFGMILAQGVVGGIVLMFRRRTDSSAVQAPAQE
ncbi:MAG: flippase-like domain-containing protein [Proteobacteria bacterium]|nr:flippase-like domain-containing protein [Pseudomonadota bacterium]